jgi:hypothetical protein
MSHRQPCTPFSVSSLAEHLDLALAASEDLMRASAANADFHTTLRLELTALTHVLQARQLAGDAIGEGALRPTMLSAFLADTDALEAAASTVQPQEMPAENSALIGGCIFVADLRLSLASTLGELGQHYSLDPDDDPDDAPNATRSSGDSEVALWAHGPDDR